MELGPEHPGVQGWNQLTHILPTCLVEEEKLLIWVIRKSCGCVHPLIPAACRQLLSNIVFVKALH